LFSFLNTGILLLAHAAALLAMEHCFDLGNEDSEVREGDAHKWKRTEVCRVREAPGW
jgi:hypothetical protein